MTDSAVSMAQDVPASAVRRLRLGAAWQRLAAPGFARNVTGTFLTRAALIVVTTALSIVVTRILGPADRGGYALAVAVCGLGVQFAGLGLPAANTYLVAGGRKRLPWLLGNSLALSLAVGVVFAAGCGLAGALLPVETAMPPLLVVLMWCWIPVGVAYSLMQALLVGTGSVWHYNAIDIVASLLSVTLIAALIAVGGVSVSAVFGAGLVCVTLSAYLAFCALRSRCTTAPALSGRLLRRGIGYGFQLYLIALASLLMRRADLFIVEHFFDREAVGVYSVAQSLADKAYLFPETLGLLLFPKLVAEPANRISRTLKASLIAVAAIGAVLVPGIFLLPLLIRGLYGTAFAEATTPTLVLIAATAFYAVGNIVGAFILSHGRNGLLLVTWLGVCAGNIAANLAVVPRFGPTGAAACLLGTYLVAMLLQIALAIGVSRRHGSRDCGRKPEASASI